MSNSTEPDRQEGSSVRESVRVRAAEIRSAQRKKDIALRSLLIGAGVIVVAAIVVAVTMTFATTETSANTGPANMASNGAVVGADLKTVRTEALPVTDAPRPTPIDPAVPNIRVYIDYLSADSGEFEKANGELLKGFAQDGVATVEIHPLAILTGKSAGSQYSLRSANAAACVANYSPDTFFAFNQALFADQPTEGTTGHDDKKLLSIASQAGASDTREIGKCIDKVTYKTWVSNATDRALADPIPDSKLDRLKGVPTIIVNDKVYTGAPGDSKEFRAFVLSVASEAQNKATASATPEPAEEAPAEEAPAEEAPAAG